MLLHWCIAEPQGPSSVAAVRFNSSVHIQSITIFPTGARPFEHSQDIVAVTEPPEFYVNLYFNAAPTDPKVKTKTNALVPTSLGYYGRQTNYAVSMGKDYVTRLIVLQGDFTKISLAIYGEVASEDALFNDSYTPRSTVTLEPTPLSGVLDVANSSDPPSLARHLLNLIPNCPPLSLINRLVLSFPMIEDDWDDPDFPYIHADLNVEKSGDLETAIQTLELSVAEDALSEVIDQFMLKLVEGIGTTASTRAHQVAKVLAAVAGQPRYVARSLLENIQLSDIFDASNTEESILRLLQDATVNADIARAMNTPPLIDSLHTVLSNSSASSSLRKACDEVLRRINGWASLEDAFSNTQADFARAAAFLKDAASSAISLGILLDSLVSHPDIVAKLGENAVTTSTSIPSPPMLWTEDELASPTTHDDFLAFLRAFIGVSCTIVVWLWADMLPNRACRDRSLSIIRLWQDAPGYREIVNHLLLIRSIMFRIETRIRTREPESAKLDAEHILLKLAEQPHVFMYAAFRECVHSLHSPLMVVNEVQQAALQHAADIAYHRVPAAVREIVEGEDLATLSDENLAIRIHALRVAIAVIDDELARDDADDGEWHVLQSAWSEGTQGFVCHLLETFVQMSQRVKDQFALEVPAHRAQATMTLLFRATDELLMLSLKLLLTFPIPSRILQVTTRALVDIFVCTDDADVIFSLGSAASSAAQVVRQTCIDTVRSLSSLSPIGSLASKDGHSAASETVLRTLFQYGIQSETRDPLHHIGQVYWLVDYVLPEIISADERTRYTAHIWMRTVLSRVLPQLRLFFRSLDAETRVHCIKRLLVLDGVDEANPDQVEGISSTSILGIGEYLLQEELGALTESTRILEDPLVAEHRQVVCQYQIHSTLQFIRGLHQQEAHTSNSARWMVSTLIDSPDMAESLAESFLFLLDHNISSPFMEDLARDLSLQLSRFCQNLQFATLLIALRSVRVHPASALDLVQRALEQATVEFENVNRLRTEIGHAFAATTESMMAGEITMTAALAQQLLAIFGWLTRQGVSSRLRSLPGLSQNSFQELCDRMSATLPEEGSSTLEKLMAQFEFPNELLPDSTLSSLTTVIKLSTDELEDLLTPLSVPEAPSTPPTFASPDPLSLVSVSPQTALLRSPVTGLTKTYNNNEFRQLRNTPSTARHGVGMGGRLPSMHVDDFESGPLPPSPLNLSSASISPQQRSTIGPGEPSPLVANFFMR